MGAGVGALHIVLLLACGVRTHYEKVGTLFDTTMPGAGRQYHQVAGLQVHRLALFATEHNLGVTSCDAECFMSVGMVVVIIEDAGAPLRWPRGDGEDTRERGCQSASERDLTIDQHRQRAIGNHAVAVE